MADPHRTRRTGTTTPRARRPYWLILIMLVVCVCLFLSSLKIEGSATYLLQDQDMDTAADESLMLKPSSSASVADILNKNSTATSLENTMKMDQHRPTTTSQRRSYVQVKESDKVRRRKGYNWAPYVIEEYKLLFFTIQKTGCTIWKQLFRRILGYKNWATGKAFPPKQVGLIMLTDYNLSEATRMINDPTWTRAIFVRDPKERFLSAYLEKAVVHSYFARNLCCSNRHHSKCARDLKSFEGFFNITERCYDTHWAAQAERLDPWYYPLLDFVGHTETAAADARILLERLGAWEKYGRSGWGKYGNESIFESTSNVNHKTSNSPEESNARLAKYYTPALEKLVEARFAGDYAIAQYNLTLQRIYYSR